jgi:hypothetical protein
MTETKTNKFSLEKFQTINAIATEIASLCGQVLMAFRAILFENDIRLFL